MGLGHIFIVPNMICNIHFESAFKFKFKLVMQNSAKRAIFFCGSIRAGRQDVDLYQRIIDRLGEYGRVLTPFVGDKTITIVGSEHTGGDKGIHDRDVEMLKESNGKLLKIFNSGIIWFLLWCKQGCLTL